ncbi:YhcH/YjgK/YiaL family protein [Dysgonamonadaceae bacterium]|nr:YhcH/YjgK/YiaL family protein [Dysgonamonadaceae bacterium]
MIIDNLSNSKQYLSLHPRFEEVFSYIDSLNWNNLPIGVTELDGQQIKVIVSESDMKSQDEAKLEVHQKFIDIQIPVTKSETFGWRSLNTLKKSSGGYAAEKDIEFFDDKPITYIPVQPGEFAIFFPGDGHAPLVGDGKIKKIIFKVAI